VCNLCALDGDCTVRDYKRCGAPSAAAKRPTSEPWRQRWGSLLWRRLSKLQLRSEKASGTFSRFRFGNPPFRLGAEWRWRRAQHFDFDSTVAVYQPHKAANRNSAVGEQSSLRSDRLRGCDGGISIDRENAIARHPALGDKERALADHDLLKIAGPIYRKRSNQHR
jgi:hypothetical protein